MCISLGGSATPQPISSPPRLLDPEVTRQREEQKRKQRAAAGSASTRRTDDAPVTASKTTLGA